ncbi:MAG: type I restriction enzyme HsdR N-terminal domain-containing protein [Paludibacteraceae bacterium]|nr:type I restriction enzyme HsdR N-terminal domain-containing protein [Paludibacteraceae bacterium]
MHIRTQNGKQYVLCAWRRRYVRLTPEEHVRQSVLRVLETNYGYPHGLIGVEVSIEVAGLKKRCDAVIYNQQMQPQMLIEFKAETVALTQQVFDQAAVYNHRIKVPFLMLSNGRDTIIAEVRDNEYQFLDYIPNYLYLAKQSDFCKIKKNNLHE